MRYYISLCLLLIGTIHKLNCEKISKIECNRIIKQDKDFLSIQSLEFLGAQRFCQIILSDCNIVFQKSKFDKIALYAFTKCKNVQINFNIENSYTTDTFKAIVPSIDFQGKHVISFVSQRVYEIKEQKLLEGFNNGDEDAILKYQITQRRNKNFLT